MSTLSQIHEKKLKQRTIGDLDALPPRRRFVVVPLEETLDQVGPPSPIETENATYTIIDQSQAQTHFPATFNKNSSTDLSSSPPRKYLLDKENYPSPLTPQKRRLQEDDVETQPLSDSDSSSDRLQQARLKIQDSQAEFTFSQTETQPSQVELQSSQLDIQSLQEAHTLPVNAQPSEQQHHDESPMLEKAPSPVPVAAASVSTSTKLDQQMSENEVSLSTVGQDQDFEIINSDAAEQEDNVENEIEQQPIQNEQTHKPQEVKTIATEDDTLETEHNTDNQQMEEKTQEETTQAIDEQQSQEKQVPIDKYGVDETLRADDFDDDGYEGFDDQDYPIEEENMTQQQNIFANQESGSVNDSFNTEPSPAKKILTATNIVTTKDKGKERAVEPANEDDDVDQITKDFQEAMADFGQDLDQDFAQNHEGFLSQPLQQDEDEEEARKEETIQALMKEIEKNSVANQKTHATKKRKLYQITMEAFQKIAYQVWDEHRTRNKDPFAKSLIEDYYTEMTQSFKHQLKAYNEYEELERASNRIKYLIRKKQEMRMRSASKRQYIAREKQTELELLRQLNADNKVFQDLDDFVKDVKGLSI